MFYKTANPATAMTALVVVDFSIHRFLQSCGFRELPATLRDATSDRKKKRQTDRQKSRKKQH